MDDNGENPDDNSGDYGGWDTSAPTPSYDGGYDASTGTMPGGFSLGDMMGNQDVNSMANQGMYANDPGSDLGASYNAPAPVDSSGNLDTSAPGYSWASGGPTDYGWGGDSSSGGNSGGGNSVGSAPPPGGWDQTSAVNAVMAYDKANGLDLGYGIDPASGLPLGPNGGNPIDGHGPQSFPAGHYGDKITDANGLTYTVGYDKFGNLTQILNPGQTPVDYTDGWYSGSQPLAFQQRKAFGTDANQSNQPGTDTNQPLQPGTNIDVSGQRGGTTTAGMTPTQSNPAAARGAPGTDQGDNGHAPPNAGARPPGGAPGTVAVPTSSTDQNKQTGTGSTTGSNGTNTSGNGTNSPAGPTHWVQDSAGKWQQVSDADYQDAMKASADRAAANKANADKEFGLKTQTQNDVRSYQQGQLANTAAQIDMQKVSNAAQAAYQQALIQTQNAQLAETTAKDAAAQEISRQQVALAQQTQANTVNFQRQQLDLQRRLLPSSRSVRHPATTMTY